MNIRKVTLSKTLKGVTRFYVYYKNKKVLYTSDNVPKTVINFIQTHNYTKVGNKMIVK